MANRKSSSELKAELDSLLASYQANNVDVETIKRAHNDLERSLRWLRNNNDADQAQIEYHKSIVESRRDYASAYNKIKMLDTKINKRCKEEEEEAASSLFCLLFVWIADCLLTAKHKHEDYHWNVVKLHINSKTDSSFLQIFILRVTVKAEKVYHVNSKMF